MYKTFSGLMSMVVLGMLAGSSFAADPSKADDQLQKMNAGRKETVERVRDLQDYKLSPEELAANAIRVEKHVTKSDKTGKIKMVSYRTFRGDRLIKQYIERDTNDDGELDLFMEMFRAGSEICAALSRSTRAGEPGMSVSSQGVPQVDVTFIDKDSDGKFDELLLVRNSVEFVDVFRRDADGLMQPVSAEEYLQAKRTMDAVAPFMGATLKAIEPVKEQKSETPPNRVSGSD